MKESAVRKHLHARVKELGGEHRAAKWLGRDHCPDDFVMLPARYPGEPGGMPRPGRHLYVESKAARAGQLREHDRMRAAGCEVLLLDTIEKIDLAFPPLER